MFVISKALRGTLWYLQPVLVALGAVFTVFTVDVKVGEVQSDGEVVLHRDDIRAGQVLR